MAPNCPIRCQTTGERRRNRDFYFTASHQVQTKIHGLRTFFFTALQMCVLVAETSRAWRAIVGSCVFKKDRFFWFGKCDTLCEDIDPRGLTTAVVVTGIVMLWLAMNRCLYFCGAHACACA